MQKQFEMKYATYTRNVLKNSISHTNEKKERCDEETCTLSLINKNHEPVKTTGLKMQYILKLIFTGVKKQASWKLSIESTRSYKSPKGIRNKICEEAANRWALKVKYMQETKKEEI